MKTNPIKNVSLTACLLVAIGYAGIAAAHTGSGTLGVGVGATDLFQVTCSTDGGGESGRLAMRVKDNAPARPPLVSVRVHKGTRAANSTDGKDGDTAFSPGVQVQGGNGVYYVTVGKTAPGVESYTLDYHCLSNTGAHTGTSIIPLQNQ